MTTTITPRLRTRYNDEIRAQLKDTLELDNIMLVPKIEKIVLNMGVGDAVGQAKLLEGALSDMETIAGQKPVITRAKKSLASFKLREGQAIGCKVTLRGDRMYEFLDRLISLAIPRIRDFRGLPPKSFDGNGPFASVSRNETSPRSYQSPRDPRATTVWPACDLRARPPCNLR